MTVSLLQAGERKVKPFELTSLCTQTQQGARALKAAQNKQRCDSRAFPLLFNTWAHALPSGLAQAHHLHVTAELPHARSEVSTQVGMQSSRGTPHCTAGTFPWVHQKPDQERFSLGGTSLIYPPAPAVQLPWHCTYLMGPSPRDPGSSFPPRCTFALFPSPLPSLPCSFK